MAPLVVEVIVTVIARIVLPWPDAVRIGLAVMFMFTGASHFSSLRTDLAAMIPPPFTGAVWILLGFGFSFYVTHFGNFNKTYGALGAAIVLLLGMFPRTCSPRSMASRFAVSRRRRWRCGCRCRRSGWRCCGSAVKSRESILPRCRVV
jgi:hypothetical protein